VHKILDNPLVAFTLALVNTRLQPLRQRSDRGASALETAIIAAVLIAAAVAIGTIVLAKVREAGTTVQNSPIPK
jgi:Flp pilus assembly protein TadG